MDLRLIAPSSCVGYSACSGRRDLIHAVFRSLFAQKELEQKTRCISDQLLTTATRYYCNAVVPKMWVATHKWLSVHRTANMSILFICTVNI